jgi:uncharacterized protein with von Willebrand factor type A (vWA) domain
MSALPPLSAASGHLDDNVVYFIRVLRAAGLPVGPDRAVDALQAIQAVGIEARPDFYWALRAVLVDRHDQIETFDQSFHMFWRDSSFLGRALELPLPEAKAELQERPPAPAAQRVMEALRDNKRQPPEVHEEERHETRARLRYSETEVLQHKDFEAMSSDELTRVRRALAHLRLPLKPITTRRQRPAARGDRIDMQATLRASLRRGAGPINLRRRRARTRQPALVVLCDISGSMEIYSRLLLHFVHGLSAANERVSTFLFGTRLTNITRYLVDRDVDAALEKIGRAVQDWSGGTRIGDCLHEFNLRWSRRVLGTGAVVLLISDGLDRDSSEALAPEMERLAKSCRRLIWLNPLLRYPDFEARPAGIRAMRPWVDDFLTAHNLASIEQLSQKLSQAD